MSLLPSWTHPMPVAGRAVARTGTASRPTEVAAAFGFALGDGTPLVVEVVDDAGAARHRDAWNDLQTRCLEPNVFLDPDFALPAAQHLGAGRGLGFIMVWANEASGRRDLVALCPLSRSRNPLRRLVPVWYHDLAALGFPLLDATRGAAALRAVLGWVCHGLPRCRALLFRAVPTEGPTASLLFGVAGRGIAVLGTWDRAVLRHDADEGRSGLAALSGKAAKEARRQRRRLADLGEVSYQCARSDDDLRDAAERFLALEAKGWKGAAGTALLSRPGQTAFFRTMTRLLGREGRCRIDALDLDGVPIAMAVVLTAGDTDFFWKMAYDEDMARLSPGVQLVLDLAERQIRGGGAVKTDSCAMPHHPMIDRLWRDRIGLSDIAIAPNPGRISGFRMAVWRARASRRLRATAKEAVLAWRDRGKSAAAR